MGEENETYLGGKKILLIILTILILGPLVFVGACFPISYLGFGLGFENSGTQATLGAIVFYGGWIIGIALAIFVCYRIIKKIIKK